MDTPMKFMATAKAQQIMSEPGPWEGLAGIYKNRMGGPKGYHVHREHWDTDDFEMYGEHPIIVCTVEESLDFMRLLNQPAPSEA